MDENNSVQSIVQLFERAIRIEEKANKIYNHFIKLFSHEPQAVDIWKDLANDEKIHGLELQKMGNSLTKDQLLSLPDKDVIEMIIVTEKKIDQELTGLNSIKDLNDAYELAHDIEDSEINAIFRLLMTKFVSSKDRVNFIKAEIKNHHQKLMRLKEKYGNKESRQLIEIRVPTNIK